VTTQLPAVAVAEHTVPVLQVIAQSLVSQSKRQGPCVVGQVQADPAVHDFNGTEDEIVGQPASFASSALDASVLEASAPELPSAESATPPSEAEAPPSALFVPKLPHAAIATSVKIAAPPRPNAIDKV
jgi:hypothetical protein